MICKLPLMLSCTHSSAYVNRRLDFRDASHTNHVVVCAILTHSSCAYLEKEERGKEKKKFLFKT